MKILLDCSNAQTGGAIQTGLSTLENAARTPEHEWHAVLSGRLSAQFPASHEAGLASVTRLPIRSQPLTKYWQIARALPGIEQALRPDLVFTVLGPSKWRSRAPQLVGYAIPHLLYPETDPFVGHRGLRTTVQRAILNLNLRWVRHALMQSPYLVVETETVRRRLDRVQGFPRSRIFVVPNSYSHSFEDSLGRSVSEAPRSRFRIFVPSAYYFHKNLEIIPRVAAELKSLTSQPFEFALTIPEDNEGWGVIRKQAAAVGVADSVRTLGPVQHKEIGAQYRRSDAVFLPTLLECSTAVYPESLAAGVPLVTSALDFAQDLCREAALYFDPYSPAEAARALHRVMSEPETRARMVEVGRVVLGESYPTPEGRWSVLLDCLRDVADGRLAPTNGNAP